MVKENDWDRTRRELDGAQSIGFSRLNGKTKTKASATGKDASQVFPHFTRRKVSEKLFRWMWRALVIVGLFFIFSEIEAVASKMDDLIHSIGENELEAK